jgi:hypothetical protein
VGLGQQRHDAIPDDLHAMLGIGSADSRSIALPASGWPRCAPSVMAMAMPPAPMDSGSGSSYKAWPGATCRSLRR